MQVSLNITGDASGAKQALQDTSNAVVDLGKNVAGASQGIQDGFNKANDSIAKMAQNTATAGAANDNWASSAAGLANQLGQIASKAAGSNTALGQAATGAASLAGGISAAAKAAGAFGVISAVLSLAGIAGTAFYNIINSGSVDSSKHLDDTTAHIQAANAAYTAAAKAAGAYYTQVNNLAIQASTQNLIALKADQQKNSGAVANSFTPSQAAIFNGSIPGEAVANGLSGALFPDQANDRFKPFQAQIDALNASIAAGNPQWEKFGQDVAASGTAVALTNPAMFAASLELTKMSDARIKGAQAISAEELNLRLYTGTQTKADLAARGLTASTNDNAGAFDRLSKSMDRQSASQIAEAQTAGQSAGVAAQLRAQFILTEAAQQSGITVAGAYADKIAAIAARAGDAAQKLAEAKLSSDTAFNTGQLGRNTIDASVADQLKGTFGTDADQNSAIANTIRLNETMKDLKSTVTDISTGAFTDLRTAIEGGSTAMQALGTVSINVLNKIIDKLANKVLDNGISSVFGAFLGTGGTGTVANGGITLGTELGPTAFAAFDLGGFTGVGGKYEQAGIVHKGEFVFDQDAVNRIGLGNLYQMQRGYADGGLVGSGSSPWRNLASNSGSSSSASPTPQVHVSAEVGVSVDNKGELQAYVKNVSAQTLGGYVSSPAFVKHVATASKVAKATRQL